MVGCGNSPFSEELHALGYQRIVNIDNCALVIGQQRARAPHLCWEVADARCLPFADSRFGVVFDKGLLDNLYCYRDPEENCGQAIAEIWRALAPGGRLVVLSFHTEEEVVASLTAVSGALPAQPWAEVMALRLRNPRFPEVLVACYTLVVAIKAVETGPTGASEEAATVCVPPKERGVAEAAGGANEGDGGSCSTGEETAACPKRHGLLPRPEALSSLRSPEDGGVLCLSASEALEMQRRVEERIAANRASFAARQEAARTQQQRRQEPQQQPPRQSLAEQLAARRLSLRPVPPLPPPPLLEWGAIPEASEPEGYGP